MRTFALIIVCLGTLLFLNSCADPFNFNRDVELDELADEYGGLYVFDKKLGEEMIQREKERKEFRANSKDYYEVDKKIPQLLSNGCEYFTFFNDRKASFRFNSVEDIEFYENKLKEFMGNEVYKRTAPYLEMTSYYQCKDKKYPLTFGIDIFYDVTINGFHTDREGLHLSMNRRIYAGTKPKYIYYLINGKFVKSDEKAVSELYHVN